MRHDSSSMQDLAKESGSSDSANNSFTPLIKEWHCLISLPVSLPSSLLLQTKALNDLCVGTTLVQNSSHMVVPDTRIRTKATEVFYEKKFALQKWQCWIWYILLLFVHVFGDLVVKCFLAYCWMYAEKFANQKYNNKNIIKKLGLQQPKWTRWFWGEMLLTHASMWEDRW